MTVDLDIYNPRYYSSHDTSRIFSHIHHICIIVAIIECNICNLHRTIVRYFYITIFV